MTDAELAKFLEVVHEVKRDALIAAIPPEKRAVYERMAEIEKEVDLWRNGLGPKPTGVLIDIERNRRRPVRWR